VTPPPPEWPEDIDTFLQMIGFRLMNLDPDRRLELIFSITRMLVGAK
jgi:hypothetical protein